MRYLAHRPPAPPPVRALWMADAQCETGSNPPNWQFHAGSYEGGIAFAASTWQLWAAATGWLPFYAHAYLAPARVQAAVAEYGLWHGAPGPGPHRWGCLFHSWVWSHH